MPTTSQAQLPRYMQKANNVIQTIAHEGNGTWIKSQRELGESLHLSQPELSNIVKLLVENDKLVKGAPLPGVRGKSHVLILKDHTLFEESVPRTGAAPTLSFHPNDRAAEPAEVANGITDLRKLDVKFIGEGVIQLLKESWDEREHHLQVRTEQNARIREFREQLQKERQTRIHLVDERDLLNQKIEDMIKENTELRTQLNQAIINNPKNEPNTYPIQEAMDEESRRVLEQLMRTTPNHYRGADGRR